MASPLASLSIDRLEKRLESEPGGHGSLAGYHALFAERSDSATELLRLASSITNMEAATAAFLRGVRLAAEQGLPLPAKLAELFVQRARVEASWQLDAPCVGVAELHAAATALGTDRLVPIAASLLAQDTAYATGWLVLAVMPHATELVDRALERLRTWAFPSPEIAHAVALLPETSRPRFAAWLSANGEARAAEIMRAGLIASLARSTAWDEALDPVLDVHALWPTSEFLFVTYGAPILRVVVARMAPARQERWFASQLDAARGTSFRALLLVSAASPACVARVLEFCTTNAKALRKPAPEWLTHLARELGVASATYLAALPKGKVRTAFAAGCVDAAPTTTASTPPTKRAARPAKPSASAATKPSAAAATKPSAAAATKPSASAATKPSAAAATKPSAAAATKPSAAAARLARLAYDADAAGARIPLALLETVRGAPGLSRVGGPGVDLGARQPCRDGLPMTHVLTVALDDAPVARDAFAGAVAFALYVAEPRGNEASEPYGDEVAVVGVTAAEVARGDATPTGLELPLRAVRATPIAVPGDAFAGTSELARALRAWPARVGGTPTWLQEPAAIEGFVMQFDQGFAPITMGDSGVMYVLRDTAFWQSR